MQKGVQMTKFPLGFVAGAVALALAAPVRTEMAAGSKESAEQCRNIADASARLECYDRTSEVGAVTDKAPIMSETEKQGVEQEAAVETVPTEDKAGSAVADPSEATTQAAESGVLTDDTGLPKPPGAYKPIPVKVSRCTKASNHKWYFYLDSGQVWQYLGARTLRYRECDTPGQLIEDRLGFSLQMDGDAAKHRVKRIR